MEYDIGSKIKAARIEKKLTQATGSIVGCKNCYTISNWENEMGIQILSVLLK